MDFRRTMKAAMILAGVPGLALLCGCVQVDDYHRYLIKKFESISSREIQKGWVLKTDLEKPVGLLEFDSDSSRAALEGCEQSLRESRPVYAPGISIRNFILKCMDGKGFVYVTQEVVVMH